MKTYDSDVWKLVQLESLETSSPSDGYTPEDCPKFDRCSAPICPLDQACAERVYRRDETVCFYMLEYVKPGAKQRFRQAAKRLGCIGAIYQAIHFLLPTLLSRYAPLKTPLMRAKRTPPRIGKRPGAMPKKRRRAA